MALLAALAVTGVAAAVADAEGPVWLVNNVELKAGQSVGAVGKGTLTFLVANISLRIECATLSEKMTLRGGGPGTDEDFLKYSECTVVEPAGCKVKQPIAFETKTTLQFMLRLGGKWTPVKEKEWEEGVEKGFGDRFVSLKEGSPISTVTLEGPECKDKGEFNLNGSYTGRVNFGLEFISELDELKFALNPAVATGRLEYEGEAGQALAVSK